MKVSVIIVTRNRFSDLAQTLLSLRNVVVPPELATELLVVDNGSTDDTETVVRGITVPGIEVRYIREELRGLSHGRNRGLVESTGDIILFTDDDIRPCADWLIEMCAPIVSGMAQAVAGGVKIAPHLLRPWMTVLHRSWLASSEWLSGTAPESLVGANMAFSRRVLHRVPLFDPAIGPGALGYGDESLFALQLQKAGYKLFGRLDVQVEHHFCPDRLTRENWVKAAVQRGFSHAYIGHHWYHWSCRFGLTRLFMATTRLHAWRIRHSKVSFEEGCEEKELRLLFQRGLIRGHLKVKNQKRNYARFGLEKCA